MLFDAGPVDKAGPAFQQCCAEAATLFKAIRSIVSNLKPASSLLTTGLTQANCFNFI